jgi:hypothetical protein
MREDSATTVLWWIARVLGTLLLITIAAFAIGEGVPKARGRRHYTQPTA